jgi:NADPH:quinone reductase-like Zn-dependent oxidoreductase
VRFDEYGGIDVLKVVDVPRLVPATGQVLVEAAGISLGEAKIRAGLEDSRWPATFPSGEGSDLAGIVAETGPGVTGFSVGDQVIGWTDNRASHAEYVVVEEQHLTAELALELGVESSRIDTIVNFEAVARYGVKAEGNAERASTSVLTELAGLIAAGELELPIEATFPLNRVQDAYRRLEEGHVLGKIVLLP